MPARWAGPSSHPFALADLAAAHPHLLQLLGALGGGSSADEALAFRKRCAWKAFQHCATYDRCVRVGGWVGGWVTAAACRVARRQRGTRGGGWCGWWVDAAAEAEAEGAVQRRRGLCRGSSGLAGGPSASACRPAPAYALLNPSCLPCLPPCCSTVAEWMWGAVGEGPAPEMSVPMKLAQGLRYGENPHQSAAFYTDASLAGEAGRGGCGPRLAARQPHLLRRSARVDQQVHLPCPKPERCFFSVYATEHGLGGVATAVQHHGKEMSYNNYLDADAAYSAGGFITRLHGTPFYSTHLAASAAHCAGCSCGPPAPAGSCNEGCRAPAPAPL